MSRYFLQCPVCNYFLLPLSKEISNKRWRCTKDSCGRIYKMLQLGAPPAARTLVEGENPSSIGSNAFSPVLDVWENEYCQPLISFSELTMLNEACHKGIPFAEYERDRIKALIKNKVQIICRLGDLCDRPVEIKNEDLVIIT